MDAFEVEIRRLQGQLDNLMQLARRNGDGEAPLIEWPPPNGDPPPPRTHNPNIRTAGTEATQGIQYFNINGQGTGFYDNNSIPFVEQKDTILRVYVDVRRYESWPPLPTRITGRIRYAGVNPGDPDSRPINGSIDARPSNLINRGDGNHSLNFRVPAWRCTGTLHPEVQLYDPAHPPGSDPENDWLFRSLWIPAPRALTFQRRRGGGPPPWDVEITDYRLRLVCVRIVYTGTDATGRPTTIGPLSDTAVTNALSGSFVSRIFPVSGINYIGFPTLEFRGNLRVEPAGWEALLDELRKLQRASGSDDVHLGLLPDGVPIGPTFGGLGGYDGVAAAFLSDIDTVAHELGHAYGRRHAPCGTPPDVDPDYPTYGTFPRGSIGEFGFSPALPSANPNLVKNPAMIVDFMSQRGTCPALRPSNSTPLQHRGFRPTIS